MPNSQSLKLFFDFQSGPGSKGQFNADTQGHRSKVWIDQLGNAKSDGQPLSVKYADNVAMDMQIATAALPAGWQPKPGNCLRVAVVFWRNHSTANPNDAIFDSPFADNTGQVITIFDQSYTAAQVGAGAVTLTLGTPTLKSGGKHDRYICLVAAALVVQDPKGNYVTVTASQDPQMNVDL